jgi:hypothetical protein
MNIRVVKAASAVAVLLTAACGSVYSPRNDSVVCTTEARAAVSLTVVDSLTGQGTGLTGLFARVVDGSFRDSTTSFFTNPSTGIPSVGMAYERKGTYTVTVRATGYQEWTRTGVTVSADECHVNGVALVARLVR